VKHSDSLPPPPPAAEAIFGERIGIASTYATLLAGPGVERGLIGPREVDRLWERHILNSAVTAELLGHAETVLDIGSGAGLPGIPIAIARPDLRVRLIEPMLRRTDFLAMAIDECGMAAQVVRGRAEDASVLAECGQSDVVVSRAVASLDKLARWSLPLLRGGGRMIALKGDRAEAELEEHHENLVRLGAGAMRVVRCGVGYVDPLTTVVIAERSAERTAGRRPMKRGPMERRQQR